MRMLRTLNFYSESFVHSLNQTKQGKKFICKTDNFEPLVVPGLSSSSGTGSSSTSTSQDLSSAGPAAERRDDPASGNWSETDPIIQNPKEKEELQSPFARSSWMVGGVHRQSGKYRNACGHISQDSDSQGSIVFIPIHQKTPNCEACFRTKMTRPKQKTHWRSSTSSRKVW